MQLKPGTKLQNGKYEIIRTLGQGGFGITYVAKQVTLNREVAIKEFFMKEYCERDDTTSQVTLGTTAGNRDLVARFREKFVREAQMIARLDHPNVVKIYDVFEENRTAYYVMEFIANGSLKELVADQGPVDEKTALKYIAEAGEALRYVHGRNVLHFDVKPSNIMLRDSGSTVLIDFGVSKHFDESGHVTSSTPVGISKGYAPMEQYRQEDISTFTPATDVYSLGATLYTLVTGAVPPDASEVYEDGLPEMPGRISKTTKAAIIKAMSPKRKERPQTVAAFMRLLGIPVIEKPEPKATKRETEETVITDPDFLRKEREKKKKQEEKEREKALRQKELEKEKEREEALRKKEMEKERKREEELRKKEQEEAKRKEEERKKKEREREKEIEKERKQLEKQNKAKAEKGGKKKSLIIGLSGAAVLAIVLACLLVPNRHVRDARNDKSSYDYRVKNCKELIQNANSQNIQSFFDAKEELEGIKWMERQHARYGEGYYMSHLLSLELNEKMDKEKAAWEQAGDAQKSVNTSRAKECYELAARLATSQEEVDRINNKIDQL